MEPTTLLIAFMSATQAFDLPPGLRESICWVESRHKVTAVHFNDGGSDSLGVCQIKLPTASLLGFKGTKAELQVSTTNIYYAGKYLRKNLDRYDGDIRKAVAAYNAGKCRLNENGLIMNRKYVHKVFNAWTEKK